MAIGNTPRSQRNSLAFMTVMTCVSMSNFGEADGAILTQLRKMLRHGFRDGSILELLYNDGISSPSSPSSSSRSGFSVSTRRAGSGKQANATSDSNFFTSGFGGQDGLEFNGVTLKPHPGNAWKDAISNRLSETALFRFMVKDIMTTIFKFVGYLTLSILFYGFDQVIPDFSS